MKNFVQPGKRMTIAAAPYARTSGQALLMGSLFGVATMDVDNGASVTIDCEGVFDLTKTNAQAWTEGVALYWDDGAKEVTTDDDSGANPLIGAAAAVAANPSATGRVRLLGQAIIIPPGA